MYKNDIEKLGNEKELEPWLEQEQEKENTSSSSPYLSKQDAAAVKPTLVRYKEGETDTDINNKTVTHTNLLGITTPVKAKEGEPEFGYEWAEEAATRALNSGKSIEDVESDMYKEYQLATKRIDAEAKANADKNGFFYYKQYEDNKKAFSPTDQAKTKLAEELHFWIIEPEKPTSTFSVYDPSVAMKILNSKKDLLSEWRKYMRDDDVVQPPVKLSTEINKLNKRALSLSELKALGLKSQRDYDIYTNYIKTSLAYEYGKRNAALYQDEAKSTESAEPVVTEAKSTESAEPVVTEAKSTESAEPVVTEAKSTESAEPVVYQDKAMPVNISEALAAPATSTENPEKTEKDIIVEDINKEAEAAVRKSKADYEAYQEWLKNPSLFTGIFGNSGMSTAKRIGLGTAALFSILSDVARNRAKGINNNTDFKTEALDALNRQINAIQDKRASAIGDMAAKPYATTTDAEEKLNKDYESIKNTPAGQFVPASDMKSAIQAAQNADKEIPEYVFSNLEEVMKEGYINAMKKNSKAAILLLDEKGNLNPTGEVEFYKQYGRLLNDFQNVIGVSEEKIRRENNRLDLVKKKTEIKKAVHDARFQTTQDYNNAISALLNDNNVLTNWKMELSEAKTLDTMLDINRKYKDVVSGLMREDTDTASTESEDEYLSERFTREKVLDEINRELNKHGFSASIDAKGSFKVPVVTNIEAGVGADWTRERANEYVKHTVNTFIKSAQQDSRKARSLSNKSGTSYDSMANSIINFVNTEKAKGATDSFDKARNQAIEEIDKKIDFNNSTIDELKNMKGKETEEDDSKFLSMFSDVPSKNNEWYRQRLRLN